MGIPFDMSSPGARKTAGPRIQTRRYRGALAAVLLVIALASCTKHEQRDVTDWLRVDIRRPVTGSSGVIVLGSRNEAYHAKVGSRWRRIGVGHASGYIVLAGGAAVLLELNDGKGPQLVTRDARPRPIREWFAAGADQVVVSSTAAVDVFRCVVRAEPSGCREVRIDRHGIDGTLQTSFRTTLPETYSDCQQVAIKGYDGAGVPYVIGQCAQGSTQAKCLLTAARADGPFLFAVPPDRPWDDCSDYPGAGVSLVSPANYTVLDRD